MAIQVTVKAALVATSVSVGAIAIIEPEIPGPFQPLRPFPLASWLSFWPAYLFTTAA